MNNIKYIFSLSLKNIARFKVINFTILLSSIFAFTILGIHIANIFGSIEQHQSQIQFRDIENVRLMMIDDATDFDKLQTNDSNSFEYIKPARQDRIVYEKQYIINTEISIVSENYIDIYTDFIFDGAYIKNPKNECVISLALSNDYNISLGDTITVGSINFNVVGITADEYNNQIIIQNELAVQRLVYPIQIYTNNNSLDNIYKNQIIVGETQIQDFFYEGITDIGIVIYIIIIIYAILSLINIIFFYKYKISTSMLTQYFLGATYKQIFLQRLFENLIIFTIATLVSYGVTNIATRYLNTISAYPYLTNLNILLILEVFAVIIAIFFSSVTTFKIKRGRR